jgi:DNA-binding NarL/FixJ family response regulator
MNQEITVFTTLKSCFRCGSEFRTHRQQRVCQSCRKPKTTEGRNFLSRELTIRERQIVGLIRFGKPNKEIAHQLHLTEGTIKEYLNRIFQKAEVSNRTELAVWAFTHQVAA